jgi:hypothetical protein
MLVTAPEGMRLYLMLHSCQCDMHAVQHLMRCTESLVVGPNRRVSTS